MVKVKVKICGLKTLDEALAAVDAGADLLGFNFYPPSPRYIDTLTCARVVSAIQERRHSTICVGVFVNAPAEHVATSLDDCGLDLAQLSGYEPPSDLATLGERAFKALRPSSSEDILVHERRYPQRQTAPLWLLDGHVPGKFGGTGTNADWDVAHDLARRAPILLAGGLDPENVTAAIDQVRPWGVDVASGVESTPGVKDSEKVRAFIRAVRSFEEANQFSRRFDPCLIR